MDFFDNRPDVETEFSSLVKEHEIHLKIFAFRVTKCEQTAKDIVQDVFLKLWENRDQLHQIENISAWLYRVTENRLIDHLRKLAADKRLRAKTWNRIKESGNETEMNLSARESGFWIARAVDRLPEQRKTIFRLNRDEHLSHQQIAETLRISRHTVKNQLSSALHQLRRFLQEFLFL